MQLCYGQVVQKLDQLQCAHLVHKTNDIRKQDQDLHGMYVWILKFIIFDLLWATKSARLIVAVLLLMKFLGPAL